MKRNECWRRSWGVDITRSLVGRKTCWLKSTHECKDGRPVRRDQRSNRLLVRQSYYTTKIRQNYLKNCLNWNYSTGMAGSILLRSTRRRSLRSFRKMDLGTELHRDLLPNTLHM